MNELVGQSIGRYHIIEKLGSGGMATVYKAYDTRLERETAIKFIRKEAVGAEHFEQMIKRFEREAKALAKFTHPNIVPIIDFGEHEGSPYFVMAYLTGGTLKEKTGGPMSYPDAARLLAPIARALEYAHERHVVHRDIKPANILLTDKGQPMLSDFGIAKILGVDDELTQLTSTGVGIGTPEYMAPEQWTGKVVPATDIYALGVVFYELVTGRKPYSADTPAAVLIKQTNEPLPRPKTFVPGLPDGVEQVIFKALAKKPEERFAGMGTFALALEKLAIGAASEKEEDGTVLYPTRIKEKGNLNGTGSQVKAKNPFLLIGGLIGLLVVAAVAIYFLAFKNPGNETKEQSAAVPLPTSLPAASIIIPPTPAPLPASTATLEILAPTPITGGGTIRIAFQAPLSGSQSAIGIDMRNGAELALEQLKDPLKVMGFDKIEMTSYDDQANPDTGVANAKQIVSDPAVLCVVGHWNSGVQIPSSEVYHTAGLANVSPANTNPKVTDRGYKEVSRIVGREDMQGKVGARFSAEQGVRSVYILHDFTSYGLGVAKAFRDEAESLGIKVIAFTGTNELSNFSNLVGQVLVTNPDLIYVGMIYDQAGGLFKLAREKGYSGYFLGPDGLDSSDLISIGGASLLNGKGVYYTTVGGWPKIYPGADQFRNDFGAKYGTDPLPYSAQAYDAMAVCLKGIENATVSASGMPSRQEVATAIRLIKDFKGLTGTVNFDSKGDLVEASYHIIKITSADPNNWGDNPLLTTVQVAPPGL